MSVNTTKIVVLYVGGDYGEQQYALLLVATDEQQYALLFVKLPSAAGKARKNVVCVL